jgi:hypothetical protein
VLPAGGFPIKETEWYFGLRIRHKHQRSRYMNIPVNVTVGPYGGWGGFCGGWGGLFNGCVVESSAVGLAAWL